MTAQPLYVETEEEIPEVIERLRRSLSTDVPLVLPNRSRLGQSRFNFQLLSHYAPQLGKRISIISADPAVQQMAEESGFSTFRAIDQYGLAPEAVEAPTAEIPARAAGSRAAGRSHPVLPRVAAQAHSRLPSKVMTRARPGRTILYLGIATLLVVGLAFTVLLVPSATVTLTAQAKPFSQAAEVPAEPGKAPVRVRTVPIQKQASSGFKTTGTKVTPGAVASGTIVYHNGCNLPLGLVTGQSLSSAGGLEFRQSGGTDNVGDTLGVLVPAHSSRSANISAATIGEKYNVGAGEVTGIVGSQFPCLTADNPSAVSGGRDEKKENQMSQTDFDAARSALQQQLSKDITDDLAKQPQTGEKLSELIQFDTPDYHTDHAPNDVVSSFGATMSLKAEAAFYMSDDVVRAFADNLAKKVPADQTLTDNQVKADYHLDNASPGGHLLFKGTASSFIAPRLDYNRIQAKLVGRSTAAAKNDLEKLPVEKVDIAESPFRLPIMPLLNSRIKLRYVVQQAGGAAPSPSPSPRPT